MKKLCKWLAVAFVALCVGSFTACKAPEDHVNPVIDGGGTVRIDLSTETFNVYDGITVSDMDDEGNKFDLTSSLQVIAPSTVTIENGTVQFPKAGDYMFTYYVSDKSGNAAALHRTVEVRNIYNLYWVSATLPVLYCALDMMTNNYKSMLLVERTNTINMSLLDNERFFYKVDGVNSEQLHQAQNRLKALATYDPYSYFRFFTTDLRHQMELFTFTLNGIGTDRYEMKMLSDGTASYTSCFDFYESEQINSYKNHEQIYNGIFEKAKLGDGSIADGISYNGTIATSGLLDSQICEAAIIAAQRDNVEWWCAFPETRKSADPLVQAEIEKAHAPKIQPEQMYANLTAEQKNTFLQMINLDKTQFDAQYFNNDGQYLIVTGTNPVSGSLTEAEFLDVMRKIREDYAGVNILFKPHPSAIPSADYKSEIFNWFNENSIKILPGRLPMEALSWVYSDVAIGGFDSSLFMSVPQNNVKFFIAPNSDSLSTLSKQLCSDGIWGDPTFYWKS